MTTRSPVKAEPSGLTTRLPAMHHPSRLGRAVTGLLLPIVLLAACGTSGSTTPASTPAVSGPDAPTSNDPSSGDGQVPPADGAIVVVPRPGQLDVHDVSADTIKATVDGRKVTVAVDWWSGVEPCTILDSIIVAKGDGSFALTLREGRGPEEVACIAIAERHRAFIDLGELEPGTYTISDATGGAAPIEVVVA